MNTLLICDIQPEYSKSFTFSIHEFINYVNFVRNRYTNIIFLYNGYETLSMINELDYKSWLYDYGLHIDLLNYSTFYDKGYGYIFDLFDDFTIKEIVNMFKHKKKVKYQKHIYYLPPFYELLNNIYGNITLIGGHYLACLREVEATLQIANKKYKKNNKFVY